jgi:hypothetical protein
MCLHRLEEGLATGCIGHQTDSIEEQIVAVASPQFEPTAVVASRASGVDVGRLLKLDSDFNDIGVRSFILSGAPFVFNGLTILDASILTSSLASYSDFCSRSVLLDVRAALVRCNHSLNCSLLQVGLQSASRLVSLESPHPLVGRTRIGRLGQSAVATRVEGDV